MKINFQIVRSMWYLMLLLLFFISCGEKFEFQFFENENNIISTFGPENNFLHKNGLYRVSYRQLNSEIYTEVINYGWACKVFKPKIAQFGDTILISYVTKSPTGSTCADEIMPVLFKYTIPVQERKNYKVYFINPDQEALWKLIWSN